MVRRPLGEEGEDVTAVAASEEEELRESLTASPVSYLQY